MAKASLKKKVERYEGLIKLGQITSSSTDYKNIQKKAEQQIKILLGCDRAYLFRFNAKLNLLEREFITDSKVEMVHVELNDQTFMGTSAKHNAIMTFDNIKLDIRFKKSPKYLQENTPKNMLLIPLLSKGEFIGIIEAIDSNQESFDHEDFHFAQAIANQMTMSLENYILVEKLQAQFIQVVEALADAIGKKDAYTGGHTKRVRHFSELIGKEMDLAHEDMTNLRLASVLHDIGKIGIEDKILKKTAPLTDAEFEVMKTHPQLGFEILGHIESLKTVVEGMRFHHERADGKGYPLGLQAEEIPKIAMIISVADTFDAMISTRPYRKGLPPMTAWQEIIQNKGTQFSHEVVDAFDRAFKKTKMYRLDTELVNSRKAS